MAYITTRFGSVVWGIREPVLTRYLEARYVEEFFDCGRLRLSSFGFFRRHPNETRRDEGEGRVQMCIDVPNGGHSIAAINGGAVYILCTCTTEQLGTQSSFDTISGFRILDPLRFAECVSRQIPGFHGGVQGLCAYRDETLIRKLDSTPIVPPGEGESPETWSAEYEKWVGAHALDAFFVKRLKYSSEAEYRFIWFGEGREVEGLFVDVPAAREFCQHLG